MNIKKISKIFGLVLLFIVLFIILGASFYVFFVIKDEKLNKNQLESKMIETVKIKDSRGNSLDYYSSVKPFVPYEEISKNVIKAFISVEDKRFYSHKGLDYKRIIGATINNLKAGYFKEGGSTITQQLAKNALLSQEKTIDRKLKEAKLSLEIEKNYTKEEILAMYLNTIYFGNSRYGIDSASKKLFNKSPNELTLGESAILAGIVKNPLKNSPLNSVENAINRKNLILGLMLEQNLITEEEYHIALKEGYAIPKESNTTKHTNTSYTEMVISEASNILGISEIELVSSGYEIHTFYDENAQNILNNAYYSENLMVENAEKSFMLVDNKSGGIIAYISSVSYSPFIYRRCPASTLKPIVSYAPAIEKGLVLPDSPILDEKQDFYGYSPNNFNNSYLGWTDVRETLKSSSNACSVKLLDMVGQDYAFNLARNFGISLAPNDSLATALGGTTYGQTIIELLTAYSTLSNGGIKKNISSIMAIYDKQGKELYSYKGDEKRVVSEETAHFLTEMLLDCAKDGTAKKLQSLPFEVASKTGTNGNKDGNFDAWNISYTLDYTLSSWYGSKNNKESLPLAVTGGSFPTLASKFIWSQLPKPKAFTTPNGIKTTQIDSYSLNNFHILTLANENTPIECIRSIETSSKYAIPTSNYFDNAIPNDFKVQIGDGEIIISYSPSPKFSYKVENSLGNVVCEHKKGLDKVEIFLPKPNNSFELYSLIAYVDDTILVKRSRPELVITI